MKSIFNIIREGLLSPRTSYRPFKPVQSRRPFLSITKRKLNYLRRIMHSYETKRGLGVNSGSSRLLKMKK